MNYEKKRLKAPAVSDEPGPLKHAPRPKFETLPWHDRYKMRRHHWGRGTMPWGYLCRDCAHLVEDHCRSYCESCKHECEGTEKLHALLMPLWSDMRAAYASLAMERTGGSK